MLFGTVGVSYDPLAHVPSVLPHGNRERAVVGAALAAMSYTDHIQRTATLLLLWDSLVCESLCGLRLHPQFPFQIPYRPNIQ